MAPRAGVSGIGQTNGLDWQTCLTTRFEAKEVFAAPANQPNAKIAILLRSPAAQTLCDGIDLSSQPHDLDEQARRLWQTYSENKISDDEATSLAARIDSRRGRSAKSEYTGPLSKLAGRARHRFVSRPRQRSPNRQASRDRRRMLGGSGVLPSNLRCDYTEGERSVLCIVGNEVKRHGICDFPIDKIAALAGVSRTTVQTTMHKAARLGHVRITARPRVGRKSLTNIAWVISPDWLAWLRRRPSLLGLIGSNSSDPIKMVNPTKSKD